MKNRTVDTLNILSHICFLAFVLLVNAGCRMSFETDIKNFLKDNTEKAAIIGYSTNLQNFGPSYISEEHPDYYCIPSTQDLVITYTLRNPQDYKFELNKSMFLNFANKDAFIGNFGVLADPSTVSIYQGTEIQENAEYQDFYITVTIPRDFLSATEYGRSFEKSDVNHKKAHDITPIIQLKHPKHYDSLDFGTYGNKNKPLSEELHIISNSAPPAVYGPAVYQRPIDGNESYSNYMLVFNMPSTGLLKDNHKDVNLLTIESSGDGTNKNQARTYQFKLDIKEDGTFEATPTEKSYKNAKLVRGNPTDELNSAYDKSIVPTGAVFDERGQPYYILTDHVASSRDIIYSISLKDDWGLKSSVQANARSVRLADIYVTDEIEDGTDENKKVLQQIIGENAVLQQDEDSSYATINFVPALNTYWLIDKDKNIQNKYSYVRIVTVDEETGDETETYFKPDAPELEGVQTEITTKYFEFNEQGELLLEDFWKEKGYVSLRNAKTDKNEYISVKEALEKELLIKQTANTSNASIIYEIYQGTNDSGNALLNGSYNCEKAKGNVIPVPEDYTTSDGQQIKILNHEGSGLLDYGNYLPLQIPSGRVFVRVYAHLKGFADTIPREFGMTILRTIVFVANDKVENGGSDANTGSENSPFATVNKALKLLSDPGNEKNTVYLKSDVTENIVIPAKGSENNEQEAISPVQLEDMKVTIASRLTAASKDIYTVQAGSGRFVLTVPKNAVVTLKNINFKGKNYVGLDSGADTDISIGKNAVVVFENCGITDCNMYVETGAKVYLNDVDFKEGIIYQQTESSVVLGGNTKLAAVKNENGDPVYGCAFFKLIEGAVVQLGSDITETPSKTYTNRELVFITTEKQRPTLNTVVLECENGAGTIKDVYPDIYEDLTKDVNPYQIFALYTGGGSYYIHYDYNEGTKNYGKGVVRIPAAYVILPEVGGFTLKLNSDVENDYWIYSNSDKKNKTEIEVSFIRNDYDYSTSQVISNKKLELKLEGTVIKSEMNQNTIKIPEGYPEGKYQLTVYFDFHNQTYSETFNIYIKEAE